MRQSLFITKSVAHVSNSLMSFGRLLCRCSIVSPSAEPDAQPAEALYSGSRSGLKA